MEEVLKNRIILILGVLTLIFFMITVSSCMKVRDYRKVKDQETAKRFEIEEKMSKLAQDKITSESKLTAVTQGLEEEKVAHQATKKALLQEQLVDQSLKEELQKVTKLKEALEEDLKEALTKGKTSKGKR